MAQPETIIYSSTAKPGKLMRQILWGAVIAVLVSMLINLAFAAGETESRKILETIMALAIIALVVAARTFRRLDSAIAFSASSIEVTSWAGRNRLSCCAMAGNTPLVSTPPRRSGQPLCSTARAHDR